MWQQWINFIAGIWLVISAYVSFSATGLRTNFIITGIIVGVLAIWGALSSEEKMGHAAR